MENQLMNYIVEKTHELIDASSCCAEAKQAGQAWLDALGTEKEAEMTKNYIAELEEDNIPIDGLIAFAESPAGAGVFGDKAGAVAEHAKEIKAKGAKYCDCPACSAVEAILAKKDEMLK